MIDLLDLYEGLDIDLDEHQDVTYWADGDLATIIDSESGELLYCEYLH